MQGSYKSLYSLIDSVDQQNPYEYMITLKANHFPNKACWYTGLFNKKNLENYCIAL